MKKILLFLSFFVLFTSFILAQEKSATDSSKKDIEILKEKIASKVAELRQENNQAAAGRVIDIFTDQIQLKDRDEEKVLIKLDEALTKYYRIQNNQVKEINRSDLKKNDYIIVSGVSFDNGITANEVFIDEKYLVDFGKIIEINKENYWLKIETLINKNLILDIETFTKQKMLNIKDLSLEKTGFSKIKEGDMINFVMKDEKNDADHYSAQKITIIPQEYFLK